MNEPATDDRETACRGCGRRTAMPCTSTRDMEDANDPACRGALMIRHNGGEYTVNRLGSGMWHAALLLAGIRAGNADPSEPDVASTLAEMARHRLVARDADGTWRDLAPESERPAIAEGLVAAGFAVDGPDGIRAPAWSTDGVLGRPPRAEAA